MGEDEDRDALKTLAGYTIISEGAELPKVAALHRRVLRTRDSLLTDHVVQDVLFNGGYAMEEKDRPKSYLDIWGGIPNRRRVMAHLCLLEKTLEVARGPLIVVPTTKVVGSMKEADETPMLTAFGFDYEVVVGFRANWLADAKLRREVENYAARLRDAFGEYNLGFVLNLISQNGLDGNFYPEWQAQIAVQDKFAKDFDRDAHRCLDSAYYYAGNSKFRSAGLAWERLNRSEGGKLFLLSQEEADSLVFGRRPKGRSAG